MVINGQGPGRHPPKGASYRDLGTMISEQGSGRHLNGALHLRPGVVKNEQESSHFPLPSTGAKGKEASRAN